MNFQSISEKITATILGLFFFSCLGFQLYALNKGFDITDEGYNLQLVQSKFVGISNTYFFETVQLLFGWLPSGLLVNRVVATILLLGASLLFIKATFRYFDLTFSIIHLFFCLLSIPFAVTLDAVTLSYNNMAAVFTLLSSACLFLLLHKTTKPQWQLVFAIASGAFAAIVCVAKITSGLALTLSVPLLILVISESRWKNLTGFIAGWIGYQLIHGIGYTPFYTQLNNILIAGDTFAQMDAHYDKFAVINDAYFFIKDQFYLFIQFVVVFVVARFIPVQWIKAVLWLLAAGYFYRIFHLSEFKLTGLVYVIGAVLCAAFFIVHVVEKDILQTIRLYHQKIVAGLFLFMIPLMVVVGTNNVYYHNYIFAGLPLAVFCTLLLEKSEVLWFKQLMLVWIAGCVAYVCYTKILFQPYRILPLAQQTETVQEGVLSGIKLDGAALNRYQRVEQTMIKYAFTKHNGLICLGKMQGLQYLLDASSPGGVMFSPTFRELYLKNLALDTNTYTQLCFVLSDYRFADSLAHDSQNWEQRFTQALSKQQHKQVEWILLDSVVFETAPLGQLFIYRN